MNKTININLGGYFFHIDEEAYLKLKKYLDAIAKSLSDDPKGKDEIITDIEARISELLSEKITDARQVVNTQDIDAIIDIMGQPEDYADTDEQFTNTNNSSSYKHTKSTAKKLFRDGDDKFLGGVCSGLGHYIGIDAIWIRLITLVLMFGLGFGFLFYIILWILLPEAKTTAEKLQMEGEPVNINNIEKKIRTEFNEFSSKVKKGASEIGDEISNIDYEDFKNRSKSGIHDFFEVLGKILMTLFKVLGKFFGALLIFIASITIISLIFSLFSWGGIEFFGIDNGLIHYPPFFHNSLIPKWLLGISLIILAIIPFFWLFVLGLKMISPTTKGIGKTGNLTLLGVWLVALMMIGFSAIEYGTSKANEGYSKVKKDLGVLSNDTLNIKVVNDDELFYLNYLRRKNNSETVSYKGETKKYSNWVKISVAKSDDSSSYIEIIKKSQGKSKNIAVKNSQLIDYDYKLEGNTLLFNAFFLSDIKNKYANESVYIKLYIPEDKLLFFNNSSEDFLYNIKSVNNIDESDMGAHLFKTTKSGLKCLDCKEEKKEIMTNSDYIKNEAKTKQEKKEPIKYVEE